MRQVTLVLTLVGSCGPAQAPTGPQHPAETVEVTAPAIPRAEFSVAPAELGFPDTWTRIRHRVRIAREGPVSFSLTGPHVDDANASKISDQPIFPVIGESGDKIRIVVPNDDARIALWMQRSDAAPTALAPVRVGDAHGRADKTSGIWLGAGANISVKPAADGLRAIALNSPYLDGSGFVPAGAIGEVWVAGEREAYEPTLAFTSEPAPVSTGTELAAGPIRNAPDGAVIATSKEVLPARVIGEHGKWTEIELHLPRVRVHGFVPASAVSKPPDLTSLQGSGHGGGYGISDVYELEVPPGACLYDRTNGEVIGVEEGMKVRYSQGFTEPGFAQVYVGNEWGLMSVWLKDTRGGSDVKKASWEICTK